MISHINTHDSDNTMLEEAAKLGYKAEDSLDLLHVIDDLPIKGFKSSQSLLS
jgi:hypothetical protein